MLPPEWIEDWVNIKKSQVMEATVASSTAMVFSASAASLCSVPASDIRAAPGEVKDNTEINILKVQANAENAAAQNSLGWHYANGQGVSKNEREAIYWYYKAANQGYVSAQINLGICYLQGKGIVKSDGLAVKWFRKAANQGNVFAQYSLGLCYEYGRGVVKDKHAAVEWYHKAADRDLLAREALERLAPQRSGGAARP